MKHTLEIKQLKPALELANRFIAEKDIVPALNHLYFKGATIRAYSGFSGANVKVPWDFGEGFALPAASLLKVLGTLEERGLTSLELDVTDTVATVKAGKSRYKLALLPRESMSDFVLRDTPVTEQVAAVDLSFWSRVESALFSVGKDHSRPELEGVFWAKSGALYSSDGTRISIVRPKSTATGESRPTFAPPTKGEGLLIPNHLLEQMGGAKSTFTEVKLEGQEGNIVWFTRPDAAVWGQMFEANFPIQALNNVMQAISTAIKSGDGSQVVMNPDARRGAMASLGALLHFSPVAQIKGRILLGSLELVSGQSQDKLSSTPGDGYESFDVTTTGPGGEFTITGGHLLDILAQTGTTKFWFNAQFPLVFQISELGLTHLIQLLRPEGHSQHGAPAQAPAAQDDGF